MTRLKKREVEQLMRCYDDDPVAALTVALRIVLGRPEATWTELVGAAGFPPERHVRLVDEEKRALDELARELNEVRTLPAP